jgi:hypothetical protein
VDDESLEDQMNQTRRNLPARIPQIYGQSAAKEAPEGGLRTAAVIDDHKDQGTDQKSKDKRRPSGPADWKQKQAMSAQGEKFRRTVSDAALSANKLGMESADTVATEMTKETAGIALLGAAGLVRGLKSGFAAPRDEKNATIVPTSPDAIAAFIAQMPPPKAIAAPLKQLPAPGRRSGPERD